MNRRLEALLLTILLLGQILFLAAVASRQSPAGDERTFYLYGRRILFEGSFHRDDERMFNSKGPAQVIPVLPQYLGEKLKLWPFTLITASVGPVDPKAPHQAYLFWARLMNILLAPLLGLVFYLWARRLHGPKAALVLLAVLVLEPNLIAVWTLIVNDGLLAGAMLVSLFLCREYVRKPGLGRLLAAGLALGAAQLVKNTAVLLAVIVPLAWLVEKWPQTWADLAARRFPALARRGGKAALALAAWLVLGLGVLAAGYGFQGLGVRLADVGPRSAAFRDLPARLQSLPLPLPREFVNGLDQVIYDDQNSLTIGFVYLDGHVRHLGFGDYYLKGFLYKLPLGLLGLLGLALLARWFRVRSPDDAWFIVPAAVVLVNLSLTNTVQLGIKYALIVVPGLLLLAGRVLAPAPGRWANAQRTAGLLLAGWAGCSSLVSFPHYVPYFNELIQPRLAYRHLGHYDLSVGQGGDEAWRWAKAHQPPLILNPCPVKAGPVLVSGSALLALHGEDCWRVLREAFQPVEVVAGEYFLFQVDDPTPRRWRLREEGAP